jgi:hypothetical protein
VIAILGLVILVAAVIAHLAWATGGAAVRGDQAHGSAQSDDPCEPVSSQGESL